MVLGVNPLFVRDETRNVFLINISHHGSTAQIALTLFGLAGQNVAGKRITAFYAA